MSAAQELLDLVKGMKPGPRHEKPKHTEERRQAAVSTLVGRMFEKLPEWVAVELPELGGDACVVSVFREERIAIGEMSTRETNLIARVDCKRCDQPRLQQLVGRTFGKGETWVVLPCLCGGIR